MLHAVHTYNETRANYADQIKPYNFLLYAPGARPPEGTTGRVRLIAPFESDATKWRDIEWTNLHNPDGPTYRLSTDWTHPTAAKIDSYRTHLERHHARPEAKSLAPDGTPCGRHTKGLLQRRPVQATTVTHLGKESNRLDERSTGILDTDDNAVYQNTYPISDPDRPLAQLVLRALRLMTPAERARIEGVSARQINRLLAGTSIASPATIQRLIAGCRELDVFTGGDDEMLAHLVVARVAERSRIAHDAKQPDQGRSD